MHTQEVQHVHHQGNDSHRTICNINGYIYSCTDGMARSVSFNLDQTKYISENVETNPIFDSQGLPLKRSHLQKL